MQISLIEAIEILLTAMPVVAVQPELLFTGVGFSVDLVFML
jgi:hypothetical protein